jgi:hypothetical protein
VQVIGAPEHLRAEHLREVGASRGILSIWIGNHRDIAIFWTFSHAWGNEKLN